MTDMESLYGHTGWRDDLQRWRALLESERATREGVTELLRYRVFDFLQRQIHGDAPPVSPEVLAYLAERLEWYRHRDMLEANFGSRRVAILLGEPASAHHGVREEVMMESDAAMGGAAGKGMGMALMVWVILMVVLTLLFGGGGQ